MEEGKEGSRGKGRKVGEGDNDEEGKGGGRKAWEGMEFPNIYLAITVFISTLFSTSFGC